MWLSLRPLGTYALFANIVAIFSKQPFVLISGASWFQNNHQVSGIAPLFPVGRGGRHDGRGKGPLIVEGCAFWDVIPDLIGQVSVTFYS